MIRSFTCAVLLCISATTSHAQYRSTARVAQVRPDSPQALGLEVAAGIAGSAAGIGAVLYLTDCGVEDLGCDIMRVLTAGAVGIAASTAATQLAASRTGSRRSVFGAMLGGAVGTGIGLGLHYLLQEQLGDGVSDPGSVAVIVVSQGAVAALGSRLIGAAKGMR